MKRKTLCLFFATMCALMLHSKTLPAAGRPDVTRHEANFLESAVNLYIEWQSPNPVVLVKISLVNLQKDIKVDPYDNKRNRDGYAGQLSVTLPLDRDKIPRQPFAYVIQLQDELRLTSSPVTGKVDVPETKQATGRSGGTIIVILGPQTIIEAGGKWRVENGPWKKSGESVSDLAAGSHTIEFQDVGNWAKPEKKNVKVEEGKTVTVNETYKNK